MEGQCKGRVDEPEPSEVQLSRIQPVCDMDKIYALCQIFLIMGGLDFIAHTLSMGFD